MIEKYLTKTEFSSYEDMIDNFKISIPENFNFAYDIVDKWAEKEPNKQALLWVDTDFSEKKLSFGMIKDYSDRLANAFTQIGLGKDDIIAIILKRRWEFWPVMVACHKIGARALPINHLMKEKDLVYRFNSIGVKAVVALNRKTFLDEMDLAEKKLNSLKYKIIVNGEKKNWISFESLLENSSPIWERTYLNKNTDIMLMYFTSGTTGFPKIVAHNYTYPLAHIVTAKFFHNSKENGLHWTIADTGWAKCAWGKIYGEWILGCCIFTYDYERYNNENVLSMFSKYKIDTFCAPPTVYRYFVKSDLKSYDFSSLKTVCSLGEALHPEVYKTFLEQTGLKIHDGFGQTESTSVIATYANVEPKPGSMGKKGPMYDVEIVDSDLNPVGNDVPGYLAVNLGKVLSEKNILFADKYSNFPYGLFGGYIYNPEGNSKRFINNYYLTGDVAKKDEDGYFWYVSRDDDVIKTSGYRVGPFEIESVLMEHPSVLECAVTGVSDKARGQIIKATIVLAENYSPSEELKEEIVEFVKVNTAPYKYPRLVEFVKELPKTISGKIKRTDINKKIK